MVTTPRLSEQALIQINQALFRLRNVYESRLRRERAGDSETLSVAEMGFVMVLGQAGRLTSRELSRRMDITPGTVSQYVSRLSGRGLLEQKRDTQDRRAWWLTLSDAGQEAYRGASEGSVQYTMDMLSVLDPDEQRVLHRLLLKASHGNGYEWQ